MSYLRTTPKPGGRRDRRLQASVRARMSRQLGASAALVAFAAGAATSAGVDGLTNGTSRDVTEAVTYVDPIEAPAQVVEIVAETAEVELEHTSIETDDPYSTSGTTRIVTEGEPGSAVVNYEVTYVDGVEVSRVEKITVVVSEPTDEVIAVGSLVIPATTPAQQGSNRALGKQMAEDLYGWTGDQWSCLDNLWIKESNWRHTAENRSSGAYGIPQSLPGTKMSSAGSDWRTNPATQIKWGLGYIKNRYGSPCGAWAHSVDKNWY